MKPTFKLLACLILLLVCTVARAQYPVSWTNKSGVVTNEINELVKTNPDGWGNGGAFSVNSGSIGWVEYTVTQSGLRFAFGLSDADVDQNYSSIDYGFIFLSGNQFNIVENGTYRILSANYAVGDVFRVEKTLLNLVYKKNGVTIESYLLNLSIGITLHTDMAVYSNPVPVSGMRTSWMAPLITDAGPDTIYLRGQNAPIGGYPTASGGELPYHYSWTPTTSLSSATAANPVCSVTATTTYKVSVTDNRGAMHTDNMIVTVLPAITVDAGKDTAIMRTESVTLGGNPTGTGGFVPLTYSWTPAAGLSSVTSLNPVATPTATTTYIVTATDRRHNFKRDTVVVDVHPLLTADAGKDSTVMKGESVPLGGSPTSTGGFTPYTYAWSPATGLNTTTGANPTASPTQTTTYYLMVTDKRGHVKKDTVVVGIVPVLTADAGKDSTVMKGESVPLGGSPTSTGGFTPYTYAWSPAAGLNTTTGANPTASPTQTTTYFLTVADKRGHIRKDTVVVGIVPVLTADAGKDSTVMKGESVPLGGSPTSTGGFTPYTYAWSPATGLSTVTGANPTASPTETTTYYLMVTDKRGHIRKDTVVVGIVPVLTADAGKDSTVMKGESVPLGGSPTSTGGFTPYTYAWSPAAGLNTTTGANPTASPTQTTTYFLMVTDKRGHIRKDTVVVGIVPVLTADAGKDSTVMNSESVTLGGAPTSTGGFLPYTYSWSPSAGLNSVAGPNPVASPTATTTYYLTVSDKRNHLRRDTAVVYIVPLFLVNAGKDTTIIAEDTLKLGGMPSAAGGFPPYTYSWAPSDSLSSSTVSNPNAWPWHTTTYTLTARDGRSHQKSSSVMVTVLPRPLEVTVRSFYDASRDTLAKDSSAVMNSGQIKLYVRGGHRPYRYFWNTGQAGSSIKGKIGKYTALVLDSLSDSLNVTAYIGAPIEWTVADGVALHPGYVEKTSPNGIAGHATTRNMIPAGQDGVLQFSFPDASSKSEAAVGLKIVPSGSDGGTGGGHGPFATESMVMPVSGSIYADYKYGVYVANGAVNVVENGSVVGQYGTYNSKDLFTVEKDNTGITYTKNGKSFRHTGGSVDPGDLLVDLNLFGNVVVVVVDFTVANYPTVAVTGIEGVKCDNTEKGSITLKVTGGSGKYTYLWSNGAVSQNISNLDINQYTVTVYDSKDLKYFTVKTYNLGYAVSWIDQKNFSSDATGFVSNSSSSEGWGKSGAASENILKSGTSGWTEFTVPNNDVNFAYGLSAADVNQNYTSIRHCMMLHVVYTAYINNNHNGDDAGGGGVMKSYVIDFYENGTKISPAPAGESTFTYVPGDVLKINRNGNQIEYYKNGKLLTSVTSNDDVNNDLVVDVSLNAKGLAFVGPQMSVPCENKTLYYSLSEKLTGAYYLVKAKLLMFRYDEKYTDGPLSYKIYDWQHTDVSPGTALTKKVGTNWYTLDIASKVNVGDYYILEVTNSKGMVQMLRFKVD